MSLVFGGKSPTATGGTILFKEGLRVHTFTASSNFTPTVDMFVDIMLIGGGGNTGPSQGGNQASGGGGAGQILLTKFVKLNSGVPYPVSIGDVGSSTYFNSPGLNGVPVKSASSGGQGALGQAASATSGSSNLVASGGGGAGWNSGSGGSGAGIFGVGFPGFNCPGNGAGTATGGGGGAGSGGPGPGTSGGNGAPIGYFTLNPNDWVCYGGPGYGGPPPSRPGPSAYGSGISGQPYPYPGTSGAAFIKY